MHTLRCNHYRLRISVVKLDYRKQRKNNVNVTFRLLQLPDTDTYKSNKHIQHIINIMIKRLL